MKHIKWGILGLGMIANEFASALDTKKTPYAIAARSYDKALAFENEHAFAQSYESYDALLDDESIDIVYIAVVTSKHYELTKKAILKHKHVLCEKALVACFEEFQELKKLAEENGVYLAEAMTIFHMPVLQQLKKEIQLGTYGKLKCIEAKFGSLKEDDENNRFFNPKLYGGAMLDIGTYALSMVFFFLEGEIKQEQAYCIKHPSQVDEMWSIHLQTDQQEMANILLTFRAKMPKRTTIVLEKAYIEIDDYPRCDCVKITYSDGRVEEIHFGDKQKALFYEIEDYEHALKTSDCQRLFLHESEKVISYMSKLLDRVGVLALYHA